MSSGGVKRKPNLYKPNANNLAREACLSRFGLIRRTHSCKLNSLARHEVCEPRPITCDLRPMYARRPISCLDGPDALRNIEPQHTRRHLPKPLKQEIGLRQLTMPLRKIYPHRVKQAPNHQNQL